ncbi:cysteine desulfurase family protein, VC1184 subfamily [Jannaschia faecimaris]|uniref:Cysteine desulfurase family protein, VC1184 subfamily n=1 Tax=Jannaschia faecimaris TaxID=1244108 RepID=A0A1H3UIA4_9RHOB|nr:cysteine desulfurase-like protein [Jannaschia faecimaris]SDZ62203.1 cysteine desulfurase family protein, VC1184 subfamily [Jannaschia faecimaris]
MPKLDTDYVRRQFPALTDDVVFLDNAGGSQVAKPVFDRMNEFMIGANVQLGATYGTSVAASRKVAEGRAALATLLNADRPEEVVMGATATQLFDQLAQSLVQHWVPGDEIVVSNFDHEANIGPWRRLEQRGIVVKTWEISNDTRKPEAEDLAPLLGPKTRLVAMTHCSNIFGGINDVRAIADLVHDYGAMLCVDGVAYAPHRAVDVKALDADFYGFSVYKTYGPHHAALYGKYDLLRHKAGNINHYFYGEDKVPNKLEPGNPNYELSYSCVGVIEYLEGLASAHGINVSGRAAVEASFDLIADHETALSERLLAYLRSREDVTIVGEQSSERNLRVPTISFVIAGQSSREIVEAVDPSGVGIRFGDFHSKRLVQALDLGDADGVIRVSAVHYNTLDEMDRLIERLESAV